MWDVGQDRHALTDNMQFLVWPVHRTFARQLSPKEPILWLACIFLTLGVWYLLKLKAWTRKKRKQEFNYSGFSKLGLICKDRELWTKIEALILIKRQFCIYSQRITFSSASCIFYKRNMSWRKMIWTRYRSCVVYTGIVIYFPKTTFRTYSSLQLEQSLYYQ